MFSAPGQVVRGALPGQGLHPLVSSPFRTLTGNYVCASGNTLSAAGVALFTRINGYHAQVVLQTGGPTGSATLHM